MKKLLIIASLVLVPSVGFGGYKNADDAFQQANAAATAGGKDGWAKVGEIKRDSEVILAELQQLLADNKVAMANPATSGGLKAAYAAGIGTATGNINTWTQTVQKITDIINSKKTEFIIGSAQKAVELKNAVKQAAAGDTSVSGNPIWNQL